MRVGIDVRLLAYQRAGIATYDSIRSRVGKLPDVLGSLPASVMAKEITTPGEGQIRAMFISAGNPVLSVPNGEELAPAVARFEAGDYPGAKAILARALELGLDVREFQVGEVFL